MFSDEQKIELFNKFGAGHSDLVDLGHKIGPQALEHVFDIFGGLKPHIPMSDNFYAGLWRELRNSEIRKQFNGRNYAELALVNNLTERQIRNILSKEPPKKHPPPKRQTIKVDREIYNRLYDYACTMDLSIGDVASRMLADTVKRA